MMVTPTMTYAGLTRGLSYKLLEEGKDYKKISIMGRPYYVPSYVFDRNNYEPEDNENE